MRFEWWSDKFVKINSVEAYLFVMCLCTTQIVRNQTPQMGRLTDLIWRGILGYTLSEQAIKRLTPEQIKG